MLIRRGLCVLSALVLLAASAAWLPGTDATSRVPAPAAAKAAASGRSLLVTYTCPEGCDPFSCFPDSTSFVSGLRCQKCINNLFVRKIDGMCGCPAGKYSPDGGPTCSDCPMQYYCPGGVYTAADPPAAIKCPANTTTRGRRSINDRSCVNLPGFKYVVQADGAVVAAEPCPADTYSPGMRKQRACVPCPTGFSTMGATQQTHPSTCVVPPGYFLKGPGQVAPCPAGEWKSGVGAAANCVKCAFGVTTASIASTSADACQLLLPGWYATAMTGSMITATAACPQGYYCPGGAAQQVFDASNPSGLSPAEPSIKACLAGMWTPDVAATSQEQCLTPPGYKTVNGTTVPCEAGSYRSGWATLGTATSCISCGSGVNAEKTDRVLQFDPVTYVPTNVPVTTSPDDCYILPGQGLFYETITQSWRARNCLTNEYGVEKITYGLSTAPCKACPQNQVTSTNASAYPNSAAWFVNGTGGARGFVSVRACVNQAGYGYNGRISQQCAKGMYNAQDTYSPCSACPGGLTTSGVGAGRAPADCGVAAGFGWSSEQSAVVPCELGTYNNISYQASQRATCFACPAGRTTADIGSDDIADCSLCSGGYGGEGCLTECGGAGENATYCPPGRPMGTAPTVCSWSGTGYSFNWNGENDVFSAQAVSPPGADSSWDCVAEFAQIVDSAWYLPTTGNTAMTATANVSTFAACVALCTAPDCEYVTYDYRTNNGTCYVRIAEEPLLMGAPLIAFKAVPSGDVGTNAYSIRGTPGTKAASILRHRHGAPEELLEGAVSVSASDVRVSASSDVQGAAVSSGQYSFYRDPNAETVGTQTAAPGRDSFADGFQGLQQCLDACDYASWCAGTTMQLLVDIPTSPRTCSLIRGNTQPGKFLRTVTRADVDKLAVPVALFTRQP